MRLPTRLENIFHLFSAFVYTDLLGFLVQVTQNKYGTKYADLYSRIISFTSRRHLGFPIQALDSIPPRRFVPEGALHVKSASSGS